MPPQISSKHPVHILINIVESAKVLLCCKEDYELHTKLWIAPKQKNEHNKRPNSIKHITIVRRNLLNMVQVCNQELYQLTVHSISIMTREEIPP